MFSESKNRGALHSQESKLFYKSVFSLVLPMALQNLINVAVTSADVIMLGSVGETVLSGSSLAGQIQFIMSLMLFGLTSGAAVLTAQYWGKGDTATIEKVLGIAMRFSLCVCLFFTVLVLLIPRQLMLVFTNEEPVIAEGVKYLRIVALAYIPMGFTNVYLNIMRSVERVVISTVVYSVSLVSNIGLNSIFIFGLLGCPAMGIEGAALATLISRIIEVILVFLYMHAVNRMIRIRIKAIFAKNALLFRDFLRYSIPVMLNELAWGAGVAMNSVVIGHMGSAAVAANSVAQTARQLSTVVAFGIANAAAIMIGKAIGGGSNERAAEYGRRFTRLTIYAGLAASAVVLLVRPIVMHTLALTPQAQQNLSMMMLIMSYFVFGQAYNTTMVVGIFRAGGDTRFGLLLDVSTMWGCSILLGALAAFVFKWNLTIVYMLLLSDEVIKIPLTTWRYRSKAWLKNVTR